MAKKKVAVAENKAPKAPPMGVAEREALVNKIEEEKAFRGNRGEDLPSTGNVMPNIPEEKAGRSTEGANNVEKMERVLAEGTPVELKGSARTAAEKEVKALREWITKTALTVEEMDALPRNGHVYTRAVQKTKMQEVGSPLFTKNATRLKLLERSLWPEDPNSGNIERLRATR